MRHKLISAMLCMTLATSCVDMDIAPKNIVTSESLLSNESGMDIYMARLYSNMPWEGSDCHLAVSLHSPFPAQRRELMPAEKTFSITEIIDILRRYDFSKQRRLSFEYIVFKGVNDSMLYAKELIKLLRGLDCRINLIRFHAIPNVDLEGTDMESMLAFRDYLTQHGVFATIRASRGEDIFAACGMLSTAKRQAEKNKETN